MDVTKFENNKKKNAKKGEILERLKNVITKHPQAQIFFNNIETKSLEISQIELAIKNIEARINILDFRSSTYSIDKVKLERKKEKLKEECKILTSQRQKNRNDLKKLLNNPNYNEYINNLTTRDRLYKDLTKSIKRTEIREFNLKEQGITIEDEKGLDKDQEIERKDEKELDKDQEIERKDEKELDEWQTIVIENEERLDEDKKIDKEDKKLYLKEDKNSNLILDKNGDAVLVVDENLIKNEERLDEDKKIDKEDKKLYLREDKNSNLILNKNGDAVLVVDEDLIKDEERLNEDKKIDKEDKKLYLREDKNSNLILNKNGDAVLVVDEDLIKNEERLNENKKIDKEDKKLYLKEDKNSNLILDKNGDEVLAVYENLDYKNKNSGLTNIINFFKHIKNKFLKKKTDKLVECINENNSGEMQSMRNNIKFSPKEKPIHRVIERVPNKGLDEKYNNVR